MTNARILIVENEVPVAEEIKTRLKNSGYTIPAIASYKEEAIQQAAEISPDLVLMDIHLEHKMDGVEAARQIRARFDIPVVYLTAYSDDETLRRAKITEPFGYILKPFTERELFSTIEIALYKYKMEKKLRESEARYREDLEKQVEARTTELKQTNEQLQQEIVERKQAEQALRTSGQQYRLLAENVADGVAIFQEEKLMFVNQALVSMLGYTKDQLLLRMDPVDLVRDDYKEDFKKTLEQVEKGIPVQHFQVLGVTRNGREIWIEMHHSFIDWEGKPAMLITMRDITERKLREIAMEEEKESLQKEIITLRSTIKDRYRFGNIVGKSQAMQEMYELIVKAAATDANVVIYGESGVGKELVAWTIHYMSDRNHKPFVPVNCGAIPDTLFEREFFGHRKGAFTGAYVDRHGFFDRAHQGTLFLDEVGEINPNMQVKLLRALESGEYIPVGSNTTKNANVRIIAATNKNLEDLIQHGLIREDFFYRIHVITIIVPPLRDRKEDIPLLVDHFLEHYGNAKKQPTLPGEVLEQLYMHDWPGNIRELQNALHRYLTVGRLDFRGARKTNSDKRGNGSITKVVRESLKFREAVGDFEKKFIST